MVVVESPVPHIQSCFVIANNDITILWDYVVILAFETGKIFHRANKNMCLICRDRNKLSLYSLSLKVYKIVSHGVRHVQHGDYIDAYCIDRHTSSGLVSTLYEDGMACII